MCLKLNEERIHKFGLPGTTENLNDVFFLQYLSSNSLFLVVIVVVCCFFFCVFKLMFYFITLDKLALNDNNKVEIRDPPF